MLGSLVVPLCGWTEAGAVVAIVALAWWTWRVQRPRRPAGKHRKA